MFPRFGFGNAANSSEIGRPVRAVAGPRNLRLGQAPVSSATEVNFWKCGKSSGCEFEQRPATLAVDRIGLMRGKPARGAIGVHSARAE
jgi:hypothetical protein